MNGAHINETLSANLLEFGKQIRSGLLDRKAIAEDGDFVLVAEMWDGSAPDFPMCMLPKGTLVHDRVVQRTVPMYRSEAVKLGLIRG